MTSESLNALRISADGWLQNINVDPNDPGAAIGRQAAAAPLRHNCALWFVADPEHGAGEPNLAAAHLLIDCAGHHPDTVPIPHGDVLVLGVNPVTGRPADLTRPQYEAMAYALLASLAA